VDSCLGEAEVAIPRRLRKLYLLPAAVAFSLAVHPSRAMLNEIDRLAALLRLSP
jgi:hypothetical protein